MKINLSKAELEDAVRFWLNAKVAAFGDYRVTEIDVPDRYSSKKEVEVTLERSEPAQAEAAGDQP